MFRVYRFTANVLIRISGIIVIILLPAGLCYSRESLFWRIINVLIDDCLLFSQLLPISPHW